MPWNGPPIDVSDVNEARCRVHPRHYGQEPDARRASRDCGFGDVVTTLAISVIGDRPEKQLEWSRTRRIIEHCAAPQGMPWRDRPRREQGSPAVRRARSGQLPVALDSPVRYPAGKA